MLPFRIQLFGHLAVTLLLAILLNFGLQPGPSELEQKSTPFTTQAEMLAVTAVLFPDKPPQISEVQYLEEGRLSLAQPGSYAIALQDEAGQDLYHLSFRVTFTMPGLSQELDEARQVFVIPAVRDGAQLLLSAPQGDAVYILDR